MEVLFETLNRKENVLMDITQEMIDQAIAEENALMAQSPEILAVQNRHLNNRVIGLRALVNEQQKEIERLSGESSDVTPEGEEEQNEDV